MQPNLDYLAYYPLYNAESLLTISYITKDYIYLSDNTHSNQSLQLPKSKSALIIPSNALKDFYKRKATAKLKIAPLNSLSPGFQSDIVYSCLSTIPAGQRTERIFALARHTYAIPTLEKDLEGNCLRCLDFCSISAPLLLGIAKVFKTAALNHSVLDCNHDQISIPNFGLA